MLLALTGIWAASVSAQVTFTAESGSQWGGGTNGPDKLFDNTGLKWGSQVNTSASFTFSASETIILTGYAMRMGADSKTMNAARSPKSWIISGSNDNKSWKQIKSVTDNTTMNESESENSQKTYYFSLDDNYEPYMYYKFEFTAVQDGNDIQISEFIPSYRRYSNTLVGIQGDGWWSNEGSSWTNVFDGDVNTRWACGIDEDRYCVVFDAGSSITLTSYMLVTGYDSGDFSPRNPTAWKIWGTNTENPNRDGDYWELIVDLDESENPTLEDKNSIPYIFDVEAAGSYRYYKFRPTKAANGSWIQLDEIVLNPKTVASHSHSSSSTYSFAGGNTSQQVELCDVCNKAITSGYKGFTLVDGKPFCVLVNGWGGNGSFVYTRAVSSSMGTICLPYSMVAGDKTDATYYTLGSYNEEDDVLAFDQVTGTLSANTPAIYVLTNPDGTSINLDNRGSAAFSVTPSDNVTKADRAGDGWAMVGTIKSGTAEEDGNSIFYLKGGEFYRASGSISYKPYRAYITGPADASGIKAIGIDDDMGDAISGIMAAGNGEVQLYDLSGRKVSEVLNGEIYILNGRKVMFNK